MNVSSRWCVTAVFALGALACSDPVPPPAQGAFIVSVKPASPAPVGKSCPTSAITYDVPVVRDKMENPPQELTDSRYTRKIIDGESSARVECAVKSGGGGFTFSGKITQGDRGLTISDGTLGADKKGTARVTVTKSGSPGFATLISPMANCTVDAAQTNNNNLQVKAGSMWARFTCAAVESAPTNSCAADGIFVFENCDQ
jgi:hypothetical protein